METDRKDLPQVVNIRHLTNADIEKIKRLDGDDVIEFDLVLANEYSDEEFVEKDYIIGEVTIDGKLYNFIHGFPGDEPSAVIYTSDFSTVTGLHWIMDKGIDPLCDWYLDTVNIIDSDGEDETHIPKSWFI